MRADHRLTRLPGRAATGSPWNIGDIVTRYGGPVVCDRRDAPLGRVLPYRRSCGAGPTVAGRPGLAERVRRDGWRVRLPASSLGDTLLGLTVAATLAGLTPDRPVRYRGPRPELMAHCVFPAGTDLDLGPGLGGPDGTHELSAGGPDAVEVPVVPAAPPTWLDVLDDERVAVHADLPMRYYLALEQDLGQRLPAEHDPTPAFVPSPGPALAAETGTSGDAQAGVGRVVFVSATSWPGRKDYGLAGFRAVAAALAARRPGLAFTLVTAPAGTTASVSGVPSGWTVAANAAAHELLAVFAGAELVIGNDSGLTHLAALTRRLDGTRPQVVGLHSRHAYTKWSTGGDNHHAVATRFSAMLAAADRCPVRDELDDTVWGAAAAITALPPALIADVAGRAAGWW